MQDAPPVAPRRPHTWHRATGDETDDYAWLSDPDDPSTMAYLEAENTWADAWFAPREALIEEIFGEVRSRVVEDDATFPVRNGRWWYSSRTRTGLAYAVHTRGATCADAGAQVVLDENAEAAGRDFFALGTFEVSADGSVLAWSADLDGSEKYDIRFRDMGSGVDDAVIIPGTSAAGAAWSADGSAFFYCVPDASMRPWRVMRHRPGDDPAADTVVFEETDERFYVSVGLSRSGEWIIIDSSSRTSSESWLISAARPLDDPAVARTRREGVEYSLDHWGDRFAVVHNDGAVDFCVSVAPRDAPGEWEPFVPHVEGERVTAFECFDGFAVMQRWKDCQPVIAVVSVSGAVREVTVLDEPHDAEIDPGPEYSVGSFRISFQSLTVPATVAEVDAGTLALEVLKRIEVPGLEPGAYVASRTWATADDGARVPVDLVRRADTPLDGSAPCLLYAYGSYEASLPPWFSVARLSLLDRGFVWALAHPRGGGEMGRAWYLEGRLLAKRNTFTDTLACAHHLGATSVDPGRIVVRGGSAGGLLVGACITMDPGAFTGAVAEVPFVDVVSTMSDPTAPLTVTEWEEWGDPRSEPWASYIRSYSPYDNTVGADYPDLYVTAGLNDPRVSYHEPAKWVARIRAVSPRTTVVMRCEMGAGHGGPSGRYVQWRDEARTLAFIISTVT